MGKRLNVKPYNWKCSKSNRKMSGGRLGGFKGDRGGDGGGGRDGFGRGSGGGSHGDRGGAQDTQEEPQRHEVDSIADEKQKLILEKEMLDREINELTEEKDREDAITRSLEEMIAKEVEEQQMLKRILEHSLTTLENRKQQILKVKNNHRLVQNTIERFKQQGLRGSGDK